MAPPGSVNAHGIGPRAGAVARRGAVGLAFALLWQLWISRRRVSTRPHVNSRSSVRIRPQEYELKIRNRQDPQTCITKSNNYTRARMCDVLWCVFQ